MISVNSVLAVIVLLAATVAPAAYARDRQPPENRAGRDALIAMHGRSQQVALYRSYLLEQGFRELPGPTVRPTGRECPQRICSEYFELDSVFERGALTVTIRGRGGSRTDLVHTFYWLDDDFNFREMSKVVVFETLFSQMQGEIAGPLAGFFREVEPSYIADSADHFADELYVSVRRLSCSGTSFEDARCEVSTVDGRTLAITNYWSGYIFDTLAPRAVNGRVTISNLSCTSEDPDSAHAGVGVCEAFVTR